MLYLRFLKINQTFYWSYKEKYPFDWTSVCQLAYDNLKKMATKAPIFANYKQSFKTIVEINSSDNISNEVFSQ